MSKQPMPEPLTLESRCEFFGLTYPILSRRINSGSIRLKTFRLHSSKKAAVLVSQAEWERFLKEREKEAV